MKTAHTSSSEQSEITILHSQINYLQEQVRWLTRQLFGQKSEKTISNLNEAQLELEFPPLEGKPLAPEEEEEKVPGYKRKKTNRNGKDRITLPLDLPVERQILDLLECEKICPETGLLLVKIGEEVSRKLAYRPGSYFIKETVRFKYALPAASLGGIRTAPLPDSLLTRCQADESFLADILVKKFADHLPLYRLSEILARQGILISRQTLCQWVVRAGLALKPLYLEMTKQVLQSENIFADETPVQMLDPGKGKTRQGYMWVIVGGKESNPPYRVYNFRTNRQHVNILEILKDYHGTLHSDKYGAYETLANRKQIKWCPCWVHIRRKFLEESGDPEFRKWILRKIRYIFMLEKVSWARSPEERLRIRQEKEVPIIDEMIAAVKTKLAQGKILPKSKFREALGYFFSLIPYLKNYTTDSWARADNNVAERAVRPIALGRKNWMFIGNENGGEAAAIILTLVQSCRAIGVNPTEYLEDVMRRVMSHCSQKLHELLPNEWIKQR